MDLINILTYILIYSLKNKGGTTDIYLLIRSLKIRLLLLKKCISKHTKKSAMLIMKI